MIKWIDDKDIFGRLYVFTNNSVFSQLRNAVDNLDANLDDAFSWGQLKSKRWLVTELEKLNLDLGTVFLCAGWYATLAHMLFESNCNIKKIRSFDIDTECYKIAETINKSYVLQDWKFKASTLDIHNMTYPLIYNTFRSNGTNLELIENPDTVVNTSCEHIVNFKTWYDKIPTGKIVVLQTNNYTSVIDHINCSESLHDFEKITPMSTVLFSDELVLEKYVRYMRIGMK